MRLIGLAVVLILSLVLVPLGVETQPAGKVYRIGLLSNASSSGPQYISDGFRQGLRELGWVEGQNILIDYRFADYRYDRLPALAAELVRLNVDIIVAPATPTAAAAKNATQTIPIVMIGIGDPVGSGFITNLAHPGGNITGLTYSGAGMEIFGKQLELLAEAVPKVRRVAILSNPTNQNHAVWMKEFKDAGRSLGVQLQLLEASGPNEFDGAFAAMAKERAGALLLVADSLFITYRTRLAALVAKNRLPALGYRELVEAGALMSYGPSLSDLGRRAATYVDKILKGSKPADLPVEQPTKLELVINLKTAKALGLTVPQSMLMRADEIIR